jgi:hypothetical protein
MPPPIRARRETISGASDIALETVIDVETDDQERKGYRRTESFEERESINESTDTNPPQHQRP